MELSVSLSDLFSPTLGEFYSKWVSSIVGIAILSDLFDCSGLAVTISASLLSRAAIRVALVS